MGDQGGKSVANPFEYAQRQIGGSANTDFADPGSKWNPLNGDLNKFASGGVNLPGKQAINGAFNGDTSGIQNWGTDTLNNVANPLHEGSAQRSLTSFLTVPGEYSQREAEGRRNGDAQAQQESQQKAQYYAGQDAAQQQALQGQQAAYKKNQDYLKGQADLTQQASDADAFTNARNAARKARGNSIFSAWG